MKKTVLLALVTGVLAMPIAGYSDTITQTVDNIDWNTAMWGSPAAAPGAGNDYVTAAVGTARFRIGADGTSSTFLGDSITVVAGTRALSKLQDGQTGTINGNLTLQGGLLSFAPNPGAHSSTLALTYLNVTADSTMDMATSTTTATIDGILAGSGNLVFSLENIPHATADQSFVFTGISGYTGALTVTEKLGLGFGVDYTFSNTLTLQDTDSFLVVNNGQTLTFGEGMLVDSVNGAVAAGTYTGASLAALGANYVDNGGTIEVIPEPATLGLIAALGGGLLFVRRRFMM